MFLPVHFALQVLVGVRLPYKYNPGDGPLPENSEIGPIPWAPMSVGEKSRLPVGSMTSDSHAFLSKFYLWFQGDSPRVKTYSSLLCIMLG